MQDKREECRRLCSWSMGWERDHDAKKEGDVSIYTYALEGR